MKPTTFLLAATIFAATAVNAFAYCPSTANCNDPSVPTPGFQQTYTPPPQTYTQPSPPMTYPGSERYGYPTFGVPDYARPH